MELEKEKQATKITYKGIIAKLEYENKLLRGQLAVATAFVSILTSILTVILISNIRG